MHKKLKKAVKHGFLIGRITMIINYFMVLILGGLHLEIPYRIENVSLLNIALLSGAITLLISLVGAIIFGFLIVKMPVQSLKLWRFLGVICLIVSGLVPFAINGIASNSGAIFINVLSLVAWVPLLYFLPRKIAVKYSIN